MTMRILSFGLATLWLGACSALSDQERYTRYLRCEVLSRDGGIVRAYMSEYHAPMLVQGHRDIAAELKSSASKIGRLPPLVRSDGEAYLRELKAGLASDRRKQVIREAVRQIEDCLSGIYD